GGYFSGVGSINRNNIARLNPDGSLDGTFDPGSGTDDNIWVVSLQTDGRIVAGGNFTFARGSTRNHIARFNSDGSLDTSFNQGPGPSDTVSAIAQQTDGKLIIGGTFSRFGTTYRQYLARLTINGNLDTTFISGNGPDNFVNAIAIQPDGKVVFGGQFLNF